MVFFLVSCGYKPVSVASKAAIGKKVYVDISISANDPQNSVLIKDAVLEAVVSRFGKYLSGKKEADTLIKAKIKSVGFEPLLYDRNGYVISYRTKVILQMDTNFKTFNSKRYNANGKYDFLIQPNSIVSDKKRFEAIKNSSLDALDEYIAFMSIKGILRQEK